VVADELNDVVHGGAGLEDAGDADFLETVDILVGNDAADEDEYLIHFVLLEEIYDARDDGIVRAGKNRKADDLNIFLQGGVDNHLWCLAEAGVNHLHARIAQGTGDDLGATVMTVEAGLGYENADF